MLKKFNSSDMMGNMEFILDGIDLENKKIPVILSDETVVVRYGWSEGKYYLSLKHGEDNVDLSRKDILSLFVNHDTSKLPIGMFENVRLEDGKLKAIAVFDEDDIESMKIFKKLSKGFLKSFSVGINVIDRELVKEEDGIKYYDVTRWSINEASVVGIPAISNAKVGLNENDDETLRVNSASAQIKSNPKGESMSKKTYTDVEVQALADEHAEALKTTGADAIAFERKRVMKIVALGGNANFTAKAIEDGMSEGDAAIALLKSRDAQMKKEKANFESGAESLDDLYVSDGEEVLDADAKAKQEAESALENLNLGA